MSKQASLPDLFNVISSPVLAAGATPCALPDGPRTDLFGRAVAPASPSAQPVPGGASPTSVTSGLPGSISSASADLTLSLVSRLKQRLTTAGSTLFKLTWREKATPAGRLVYRLAASGRRTSDKDSGSWATPKTTDCKGAPYETTENRRTELRKQAYQASWPTPQHSDPKNMTATKWGEYLSNAALLASWPTPQAMDTMTPRDPATFDKWNNERDGRKNRKFVSNLPQAVLQHMGSWPTTTVTDAYRGERYDPMAKNMTLNMAAQRTSWPTPMEHEARLGFQNRTTGAKGAQKSFTTVVVESLAPDNDPRLSGLTAIGSPAATEKPGQLNPAHSRWLMGYPAEWDACAPTATPSSRKSRKSL